MFRMSRPIRNQKCLHRVRTMAGFMLMIEVASDRESNLAKGTFVHDFKFFFYVVTVEFSSSICYLEASLSSRLIFIEAEPRSHMIRNGHQVILHLSRL